MAKAKAKAKKIQKYEMTTKLPLVGQEYEYMKHYSLRDLLSLEEKTRVAADESWDRFSIIRKQLIAGDITEENWRDNIGEWNQRNLCATAFLSSPEFHTVNDAFLAEYDSREDLQELYKTCNKDRYWMNGRYGSIRRDDPKYRDCLDRPDSYLMFNSVYEDSAAKKMREVARETPYLEGDLVLLRKPYIGHRDIDPYWVNPYLGTGEVTPDKDTPRIATVIGVTDEVTKSWRVSKGSKIIKVVWIGKEDIQNVEERYIKWHMRPTYKNGLKTRPQE